MNKKRIGIIAGVTFGAITIIAAGTVLAATFALDKSVPATVTITSTTPPPPPPPPPPTPATVYSDATWQTELTSINFGSADNATAGSLPITVYVKPTEINVTTVQASGVTAPYTVSVTSTDQATGAVQITLVVPAGQPAGTGISVGNVHLTGNGPPS